MGGWVQKSVGAITFAGAFSYTHCDALKLVMLVQNRVLDVIWQPPQLLTIQVYRISAENMISYIAG
jgi:hypothetical protein